MPASQRRSEAACPALGQPQSASDAGPVLPALPVPPPSEQPPRPPRAPPRGRPRGGLRSGRVLRAAAPGVSCASLSAPRPRLPGRLLPASPVARPLPAPARAAARGQREVSGPRAPPASGRRRAPCTRPLVPPDGGENVGEREPVATRVSCDARSNAHETI